MLEGKLFFKVSACRNRKILFFFLFIYISGFKQCIYSIAINVFTFTMVVFCVLYIDKKESNNTTQLLVCMNTSTAVGFIFFKSSFYLNRNIAYFINRITAIKG